MAKPSKFADLPGLAEAASMDRVRQGFALALEALDERRLVARRRRLAVGDRYAIDAERCITHYQEMIRELLAEGI